MKKIILTSFLGLFSPLTIADISNLSLNEAIEIASKQNIDIIKSKKSIEIAKKDLEIIKSKYLGSLDLSTNFINSNSPSNVFGFKLDNGDVAFKDFGFTTDGFQQLTQAMGNGVEIGNFKVDAVNNPDSRNYFSTNLTYSLPIYTGGLLESYEKISEKMVKMNSLSNEDFKNEITLEIKKSFYQAKLISEIEKDLKIILKNLKKLEMTIIAMHEEGFAKKVDILEVSARIQKVENSIEEISLNKKLIRKYLGFLIQDNVESLNLKLKEINEVNHIDINQITKVKMAKLGVEIRESLIDKEESALLPTIGAFGQTSSSSDSLFNSLNQPNYTVGVQLNWTIYDWGGNTANIEKAEIERDIALADFKKAKSGLTLKVDKAKIEIESLKSSITAAKAQDELLTKIVESYEERYKENLVSVNDVLVKNALLIENKIKLKQIETLKTLKILELNSMNNFYNKKEGK